MPSNSKTQSDYSEFQPAALEILDTPPSPVSRILIFTIIGFFVTAIGWSIWGQIDVIVTGQGRVIPTGQVKTVQAFEAGIVAEILVEEGAHVTAGQTVIALDPTETNANAEILVLQIAEARLDFAVAEALLTEQSFAILSQGINMPPEKIAQANNQVIAAKQTITSTLGEMQAEAKRLRSQLMAIEIEMDKLDTVIPVMKERLAASGTLLRRDAMRQDDRLVLQQTLIETQAARRALDQSLDQTHASLLAVKAKEEQAISNFQSTQLSTQRASRATISDLEQKIFAEQRRQTLRNLSAPVSGYVDKLVTHTVGGVVGAGEVLMYIVPEGSTIEIEAMVQNKDIGFIRVDYPASIKLEAFPFTRYGVLDGIVTNISNDAIAHETFGLVYKVTAKITTSEEAINNVGIAISPGMSATLEIQTDKRRVIDYFISPVLRYKDEAIRER